MKGWEAALTRVAYYVVPRDQAWAIRLNGKYFGPCANKRVATDVAISAAKKALASEGCRVTVLVQDGNRFLTEWEGGSRQKVH
jgi:hypothetical protein